MLLIIISAFDQTVSLECENLKKKIFQIGSFSSSQVNIPKEQIIFPADNIFQRNGYFEDQIIECVLLRK